MSGVDEGERWWRREGEVGVVGRSRAVPLPEGRGESGSVMMYEAPVMMANKLLHATLLPAEAKQGRTTGASAMCVYASARATRGRVVRRSSALQQGGAASLMNGLEGNVRSKSEVRDRSLDATRISLFNVSVGRGRGRAATTEGGRRRHGSFGATSSCSTRECWTKQRPSQAPRPMR